MIRVGMKIPAKRRFIRAALRGLVATNREYLRTGRFPRLYESGVYYKPERKRRGPEDWQTVAELHERGHGDCEDLAAARAAELQEAGDESAYADAVRTGAKRFHAIVVRGDGTVEDPSRKLRRR